MYLYCCILTPYPCSLLSFLSFMIGSTVGQFYFFRLNLKTHTFTASNNSFLFLIHCIHEVYDPLSPFSTDFPKLIREGSIKYSKNSTEPTEQAKNTVRWSCSVDQQGPPPGKSSESSSNSWCTWGPGRWVTYSVGVDDAQSQMHESVLS